MNCEEARTHWHARRDEGVGATERALDGRLDDDLASCEACRAYDAEMSLICGALGALASEDPVDVVGSASRSFSAKRFEVLLRIAATIALLVGGVWWIASALTQQKTETTNTKIAEGPTTVSPDLPKTHSDERIGLSLRGASAGEYLAMQRPTTVANVRLYWLYPTVATSAGNEGIADEGTP